MEERKALVATTAADIYAAMDKSERAGVRFGLYPSARLKVAENAIKAQLAELGAGQGELARIQQDLCAAIRTAANRGTAHVI